MFLGAGILRSGTGQAFFQQAADFRTVILRMFTQAHFMIGGTFDCHDDAMARQHLGEARRQSALRQLGALGGQFLRYLLHQGANERLGLVLKQAAHPTQARTGCGPIQNGLKIRNARLTRPRPPGDDLKEQGQIAHAAGQWTGMIHAWSERDHAVATDQSEGGFEAAHAAVGGGPGNRAPGLRAKCAQAHAGGQGGRRAAAGTTRRSLRIPGVTRHRRIEAGILGGDGFAQKDGAGLAQALDHRGILAGHAPGPELRAGRRGPIKNVKDVFDADGNAVQGPAVFALLELLRQARRLGARPFPVDEHPGGDLPFPAVNLGQALVEDFERSRAALANGVGSGMQGSEHGGSKGGQAKYELIL